MITVAAPDMAIRLRLDPYAPRAARHCVAQVDRPSPDLRDAVMLLTSEVVTRAVEHSDPRREDAVELRVWMSPELVRVEIRGREELLSDASRCRFDYEQLLLDSLADRWALECGEDEEACMWFEIDRRAFDAGAERNSSTSWASRSG